MPAHQFLRLGVLSLAQQTADFRQNGSSSLAVGVLRRAGPHGTFVEHNAFFIHTTENHRSDAPVAERGGLEEALGRRVMQKLGRGFARGNSVGGKEKKGITSNSATEGQLRFWTSWGASSLKKRAVVGFSSCTVWGRSVFSQLPSVMAFQFLPSSLAWMR